MSYKLVLAASTLAWLTPTCLLAGDTHWLFVGTYTQRGSQGIYRLGFDAESGALSAATVAAETANPSFLAIAPSGKHLYAVGELSEFKGKKTGGVTAFSLDARNGDIKQLNQQSSEGTGPCHCVVDRSGRFVLVANYGGGSVAVLPIEADGRLAPASSFVQHVGKSADPRRQDGPHAHSINVDAKNRYVFVADLGLDQVLVYKFDAENGKLSANEPSAAIVAPGSGPRHFAFHPDGKSAFVINELANTLTAFRYDADKGVLTESQTLPTLPADFQGKSWTAEVQVHPNGKFVYGSNRGHNSIAIFAKNDEGTWRHVGNQSSGINIPRNFAVDPTGKFVLVGNQEGDSISVFKVTATGELEPIGKPTPVPMPVCLKFVAKG